MAIEGEPRTTLNVIPMPHKGGVYATPEVLYAMGLMTLEQAIAAGYEPPPTPSWHQRLRWDLRDVWDHYRPTVHLGPCDHSECC